jgi:hypothetical protein
MSRKKNKKKTREEPDQPEKGIKYYRRKVPDKFFMDELKHTMNVYRDLYNAGLTDSFFDLYNDVMGLVEKYERKGSKTHKKEKPGHSEWPLYK